MVQFLGAAFVVMLLVILLIAAGIGVLLNLLAGRGRAAVCWLLGFVSAVVLLIFVLGGF